MEATKRDLIGAELDHVEALLQISARRDMEILETSRLLKQLSNHLDCIGITGKTVAPCPIPRVQRVSTDDSIDVTLRQFASLAKDTLATAEHTPAGDTRTKQFNDADAEIKRLRYVLDILYLCAALASRGDLPVRLAESRMATEQHRYAIRCNAIIATSYERIAGGGVERLALYYKGGVKPETLAQLFQSATTLGLIPAVALR